MERTTTAEPAAVKTASAASELYMCTVCGWIYDEAEGLPEANIAPGTRWEDVPEDFTCPECHEGKDVFERIDD